MSECLWKSFHFNGSAFELLKVFERELYVFLLDSSRQHDSYGRYSFIGFDPFDIVSTKDADALDLLKQKYARFASTQNNELSPLMAGMVGYFSYDLGFHQEKICLSNTDDLNLPDCFFGFYDCIITIDHLSRKMFISSTGLPEKSSAARQKRASKRLDDILHKIADYSLDSTEAYPPIDLDRNQGAADLEGHVECNMTKIQYLEAVERALDYIARGDIYQINLSQRFVFDFKNGDVNPTCIYHALRALSPSSFGCYFDGGDFQIISSSPEQFLSLNNGLVRTRPMKGTRPRGKNSIEDDRLKKELLESAKEKAELLMVTDLERNDLGKVCAFGSIEVQDRRLIEGYKTVFQATSTIKGMLNKDRDGFDLIKACFPGGSITGCPKIRAMNIIEELEPTRRGVYTGALGYMSFAGNMDFNILIRTMLLHRRKAYLHVGGGIVADSRPEQEYAETLVKAQAMFESLRLSHPVSSV